MRLDVDAKTLLPRARSVHHAAAALLLATAAPLAAAAPVTWTLTGHFTGAATDKPEFIAAISPLLGTQALSLTLTIDPAAPAGTAVGGETLYRAITGSTAQFAGFDTVASRCPSAGGSELICTVQAHDGRGRPPGVFDPDRVSIFPATHASSAFEAATGLGRPLALQFMMFATDIDGGALADESLASALDLLTPGRIRGFLGVFARGADGLLSDWASFEFRLDSVTTGAAAPTPLPEPGSALLAALALATLTAVRRHPRS